LTIAFDTSIATSYLDPAEVSGAATPFTFLYACTTRSASPCPEQRRPVSGRILAESADGLTYEFKLREGLTFHNGDPFTAEDVKFSFHRYRGFRPGSCTSA